MSDPNAPSAAVFLTVLFANGEWHKSPDRRQTSRAIHLYEVTSCGSMCMCPVLGTHF